MRSLNSIEVQNVSGSYGPIMGGFVGASVVTLALYSTGYITNFPARLLVATGAIVGAEIGFYLSPIDFTFTRKCSDTDTGSEQAG